MTNNSKPNETADKIANIFVLSLSQYVRPSNKVITVAIAYVPHEEIISETEATMKLAARELDLPVVKEVMNLYIRQLWITMLLPLEVKKACILLIPTVIFAVPVIIVVVEETDWKSVRKKFGRGKE